MSENMKKARPDVAASRQAEVVAGLDGSSTSTNNFTTPSPLGQAIHIADFLSYGPENGLKISDLERLTGWTSREIRKQIERERRTGTPILSNNRDGYYLPSDTSEAETFVRSMLRRSQEIAKTARKVAEVAGID